VAPSIAAEDKPLVMEVSPSRLREGETFTIEMRLDYPDPSRINIIEPAFPEALSVVRGPDVKMLLSRRDREAPKRTVSVSYEFRANEPGRHVLGSFILRAGGDSFLSRPASVAVLYRDEDVNAVLFEPVWQLARESVYAGQTVACVLELQNVEEILLPDELRVVAPRGAVFEQAAGVGRIRSEALPEMEVYHVPVASSLLTPTSVGRLEIPAARVTAKGKTRYAQPTVLTVQPAPTEIETSGAIGDLGMSVRLDRLRAVEGEQAELTIRVEGRGNLAFLRLPAPVVSGLTVHETEESEDYDTTEAGYVGYRETVYRYTATEPGEASIEVPAFRWLDPEQGAVRSAGPERFTIEVESLEEVASGPALPFSVKPMDHVLTEPFSRFYSYPAAYLWFLPGPLAVVLFAVLRRMRARKLLFFALAGLFLSADVPPSAPPAHLVSAFQAYEAEDYERAARLFRVSLGSLPDNAALWFNRSLTMYQAGRPGHAVYAARKAVRLRPMATEYRELLDWIHRDAQLEQPPGIVPGLHPDVFFVAMAILFGLFCAQLVLALWKRRGGMVIVLVLLAVLSLGSLGGFLYVMTAHQQLPAVVMGDGGQLRRIPQSAAATWLTLPEGTSVRVLGASGSYVLVETGYDVQGWISQTAILRL
jgi:hypothetical protein